jgi:drug/metabolite transporter (DMT)-like permease
VTVVYAACAVSLLVVVVAGALGGGSGGEMEIVDVLPAVAARLFDYPAREWLLFLGMAVGPGLLGHTVVNWALAHVESSVVSVSLLGEPVGATLLAALLLGERAAPLTLVGGAVVLAGVALTARSRDDGPGPAGPHGDEEPDPSE